MSGECNECPCTTQKLMVNWFQIPIYAIIYASDCKVRFKSQTPLEAHNIHLHRLDIAA